MLDGVVIDDTRLFNTKLQQWDFYNFYRPTAASTAKLPTNGYDKGARRENVRIAERSESTAR